MLECRNDEEIMIVVGDSYDLKIYFNNIDFSLIEDLFFTCSKLNISKKFYAQSIDDDNFYILSFNPMETEEFTPCVTDYDLTIKLTSGYTETISYRSKLKISPKTNPIVNKTGLLQIKSLDWDGVIFEDTVNDKTIIIKGNNSVYIDGVNSSVYGKILDKEY